MLNADTDANAPNCNDVAKFNKIMLIPIMLIPVQVASWFVQRKAHSEASLRVVHT